MTKTPAINYAELLNEALRRVVREALSHARVNGLGETGCLHITFKTRAAGVVVPDFLKMRYPDTMTVVLQWTFSNLNVSDAGFGVTLNFDGRPFYIQIPFAAMTEFKDLQSEFMLQFTPTAEIRQDAPPAPELPLEEKPKTASDPRILSMDEFRKRKQVKSDM
ncbi:MAG: ClpXP protease specificity-enhancing factor SspB [Rickettsiales bacterium]|jgi:hypothetical protein|nr:ClpXP protease specificity-enhancing factor SspB [Rickettsiales bacterium]